MNHIIIEKKDRINAMTSDTYLFNNDNTIQITQPITNEVAKSFIMDMYALKDRLKEEDNPIIKIFINSPGGSVDAGLSMIDVINDIKKDIPIEIICYNRAASMAAVIATSGSIRKAYKNTKILIHEMLVSEMKEINVSGIEELFNEIKKYNEYVAGIIARNSKTTLSKVLKKLKENKEMTAQEAKEFGLIDEII